MPFARAPRQHLFNVASARYSPLHGKVVLIALRWCSHAGQCTVRSATDLYRLARECLDEHKDIGDAWLIYRDEANARYGGYLLLARGGLANGALKRSETMSRDRSLGIYGLSHLEALEFRMPQIERSGRIITCTRMRSAELLRFSPCLEGGFALPHRM